MGGPVAAGSGELEFVSSGIGSYPVTWASRVERPDGRTSPEELLAASHAACYAMALNATLGRDSPPPGQVPGGRRAGGAGLPISNALRNNLRITVKATLES